MYAHERSLVKQMQGRPFALLGVNSDGDRDLLRSRIIDEKINWRSFWAGPEGGWGAIPGQWGISSWPTIFLIDHDGIIRAVNLRGKALDLKIEELVKKAEASATKSER